MYVFMPRVCWASAMGFTSLRLIFFESTKRQKVDLTRQYVQSNDSRLLPTIMTSLDGSFRSTDETDVYSDEENQARAKRAAGEAILQTRDRRTVWILLSLTLALLIGVAVTLCVFIYKFVSDEEHEKYDVAFQSQSRKLLEVATSRLDERVNAIKLFSLGITSNMLATGSNWTELYLPYMVS